MTISRMPNKICNITLIFVESPKFRVSKEIGVEKHDGDVRF